MAPIPKDNKEKLPNENDSEINMFSNPSISINPGMSDTSDDNEDHNSIPNAMGYTLLGQEPTELEEDSDDDEDEIGSEDEKRNVANSSEDSHKESSRSDLSGSQSHQVSRLLENLPDSVTQSDLGATGLTVPLSGSSCHPAFLAKFPDGKIPAYMQVPSIRSSSRDLIWNQKRQEKSTLSLDTGQESQILKAMSGFSLPRANIPEWAKNMSDDQWKQQVMDKLSPDEKSIKLPTDFGDESGDKTRKRHQTKIASETLETTVTGNSDWVASFPDS